MTGPTAAPSAWVVNGWTIYPHPIFLGQLVELIDEVEKLRKMDPESYTRKNATKRLAAIFKLVNETIPSDPTDKAFRLGGALGDDYKHWFRAKFFQQYRLFFRYDERSKIIVVGWVNDEETLRAYGSKTDAYRVFAKMLVDKNPPDNWEALLKEAKAATNPVAGIVKRLASLLK
jgi:toxin YhaV